MTAPDEEAETGTGDEEAEIARRKFLAKLRALDRADAFKAMVGSKQGRLVVWAIVSECGVYSDDFRGEETHSMARASGRRSIGLWLLEQIFAADPDAYGLMRAEAVEREAELAKRSE